MHKIHPSCMPNCSPDHILAPVSNADKITNFALDKIQHMIDATTAALPKATQYVLQVTSIQCTWDVITWCLLLCLFAILAIISFIFIREQIKLGAAFASSDRYSKDPPCWQGVLGCILGAGAIIATLITIFNLPYWSFIGINHPDLYLVHLAVNKFLN